MHFKKNPQYTFFFKPIFFCFQSLLNQKIWSGSKKVKTFVLELLHSKSWNFWEFRIYGLTHVIKRGCSEYYATCTQDTCQCKQPQKQPIQNHGNKFPIFNYLYPCEPKTCWIVLNHVKGGMLLLKIPEGSKSWSLLISISCRFKRESKKKQKINHFWKKSDGT